MNAMVSESTAQAKVTAKAAPYLSFIHVSYMFHTSECFCKHMPYGVAV